MDELVSGRIAASLVAFAGDREDPAAVRRRLEEAGLARVADVAPDSWLSEAALEEVAGALSLEGEAARDLAREAGAAALHLQPMGGLAHLVPFLGGPRDAYHHLPHLLPLFLQGAVVAVADDGAAGATVEIGLPDGRIARPVLIAFAVGLFESLPTWWRLPRGTCTLEPAAGPDGLPRLRFHVAWEGEPGVPAPREPRGAEQERATPLGRVELVARLLREGTQGAVFEVGADGAVAVVEPGPQAALGLDERAVGRSLADVHPAWAAPPLRDALEAARQGRAEVVTARVDVDGRPRSFRVRIHPLPAEDEGPRALLGTVVDWTDARRRQTELARTSRLSNVGRLAAATAHEFNNALTGILGYADLGLRTTDPDRRERALAIIQETAGHAHRLAENLLHHARERPQGDATAAPVDLADVVRRAVELLAVTTRSRPVRIIEDTGGAPPVRGRTQHYQQIVMNLLQNALDALPEEGGTIHVHARRDGSMVALEFADDGRGMSEEVRRQVLEPFYTTKHEQEGTLGGSGLGLAVCDALTQEMGGALRIDSVPGDGTRVTLVCPVAEAPDDAASEPQEPSSEPEARREEAVPAPLEVLVVDDEEVVRTLLMDIATHEGHIVSGAAHGGEAWKLLAEHHYDLLFLDVLMPVMNGIELLGRLRDMAPRPRVVMMSGKLTPEVEEAILRYPVAEVLTKPFAMQRILDIIERTAHERAEERAS